MYALRLPVFILVLLSFVSPAFAQPGSADPAKTGSVSGKLIDAKKSPVSYATVTLLRTDSTVVNGDLSKDDGSFRIAPAGIGSFLLRIESMGAATKIMNLQVTAADPDKKLGVIKVSETENKLEEVSITGEKRVMELKVDKKVFNVEKNTTTAGGSAADVLQNVPAVSVGTDGEVSLRGKTGVTILIDGKPATLLGSDVNSALQSMPAGSIESVEVITNPSAKYDAQGTSGIINIITKKDGRFGMNGNVTLGAGTRDKYNGNLGLNARKGKWNVFLNSSFRLNSTFNNVITDRQDKQLTNGQRQTYHTYEHVPRAFNGNFNSIGATYDANKYNSFTLTQNVNVMKFSFRDGSDYTIFNEAHEQLFRQDRFSSFSGMPVSSSTSLDYKHKFKKKDEELSVDGTFAYTAMKRDQMVRTGDVTLTAPGSGDNKSLNVWADYTDPLFTKNGKLGLGFKSQLFWFNSSNNPLRNANGVISPDLTLLSVYNYTQQTHAAYVNWSDQVGKFSYQAGLRAEDAAYDGYGMVPQKATFTNSFTNLFPSAFVSYQLPHQQSVYLNYSRRTNRPGFMQLLPFVDISNPSTVNKGNPGLIPEFIDNFEFSYNKTDNKGNNIILSTYYAVTQNLTQRITRPLDSAEAQLYGVNAGTLFTTPLNITSGATYGVEGTGHVQIIPIWDATINLNFFRNQLNVGSVDPINAPYLFNNSGNSWFGKVNTNIKLPKNFSFQVNANYESPKVISQGSLRETYWIDLAIKKNFWKNKATLVVNCSDILKTHILVMDYDIDVYSQTINRIRETRIGNLNFTYRFGKSETGKAFAGGMGGKRGKGGDDKLKPVKPNDDDRQKNLKEGGDDDQGGGGGGGQKRDGNK